MDDKFRAGLIPFLLLLCLANSSCDMLSDLGLLGDNKKPVSSQIKKQAGQMRKQADQMEQMADQLKVEGDEVQKAEQIQ